MFLTGTRNGVGLVAASSFTPLLTLNRSGKWDSFLNYDSLPSTSEQGDSIEYVLPVTELPSSANTFAGPVFAFGLSQQHFASALADSGQFDELLDGSETLEAATYNRDSTRLLEQPINSEVSPNIFEVQEETQTTKRYDASVES